MTSRKSHSFKVLVMAAGAAAMAACASGGDNNSGNISLASLPLGGGKNAGQVATVNKYLWAASLETLDFLPMQSADPISGLILTDWYSNPQSPDERFKADVYILDSALRADGLRVSIFRQVRTEAGWADAEVNPATGREIENAILTRARQLRLNQLGEDD